MSHVGCRVDTDAIEDVEYLFKGHDDLHLGFNTFLSKEYAISPLPEDENPKNPVDFLEPVEFVNKVCI